MQPQATPDLVQSEFARLYGETPRMYQAPARMNIIGEHLDYNGGRVLPATVDLFTWAAVSPRDDRLISVHLCHDGSQRRIDLNDIRHNGSGDTIEYLKGVVWGLQREGVEPRGCNVVIGGNIPLGGGLSSSASLEVLMARVLAERAVTAPIERERLALVCQRAESEFVGVQCGIMDQFAIALGRRGHAMLLDCSSLDYEQYPVPAGASFVIAHCGVSRRLPSGDYNSRRGECRDALARLTVALPELGCLADLPRDQLEVQRSLLSASLYRRCRHVVTESARVDAAVQALRQAELETLGMLMNESNRSLSEDFEVSCPEMDALVEVATSCDGVLGARMMGGGFGGCAIVLVRSEALAEAAARIREEFGKVLGREPWVHEVGPAGPVAEIRPGRA